MASWANISDERRLHALALLAWSASLGKGRSGVLAVSAETRFPPKEKGQSEMTQGAVGIFKRKSNAQKYADKLNGY
jgi:hypothetical protein